MTQPTAFCADQIFDGNSMHEQAALLVRDEQVVEILPQSSVPSHFRQWQSTGDMIVPGFVDLQVNGGGGALFNDEPTVAGIETICSAHARFGTTALLPTLITDSANVRDRALAAGRDASAAKVAGYLGLHLEGPHLSVARKGAHVSDFIRPMDAEDLSALVAGRDQIGCGLITVAPENVSAEQVRALSKAGWNVSLGHSNCKAADAFAYFAAGASMVTHLFNAMSQLTNREPGLVGAALATDPVYCGLIADGIHVDIATMKVALRAKRDPGQIFFVTDAMSPTGTDVTEFILGGRTIYRRDGRLTLADGTLAGADIDMMSMVRHAVNVLDLPLEIALRMASTYPADAIGVPTKGRLGDGCDADFLMLNKDLSLQSTWIAGQRRYETEPQGA
ncbi:N-acetylglucosamine-6-phosphate deacetylase [Cohaesibacter celericrescens]|uniref:N-acetylglucosamine-6-phosphate deacetylase n=1 Tax=Cohaesibacter celericrescens TaxID=2067669 RepID=UPI00356651CB